MDDFKQRIVTWFVQQFAARAVIKLLSSAAVLLAAHGLFKHADSTTWVNSNAEVITGGIAWGLTWLLSRTQHTAQKVATNTAVTTALQTETPAPENLAATAKAIIDSPTPNGLQ